MAQILNVWVPPPACFYRLTVKYLFQWWLCFIVIYNIIWSSMLICCIVLIVFSWWSILGCVLILLLKINLNFLNTDLRAAVLHSRPHWARSATRQSRDSSQSTSFSVFHLLNWKLCRKGGGRISFNNTTDWTVTRRTCPATVWLHWSCIYQQNGTCQVHVNQTKEGTNLNIYIHSSCHNLWG